ncbi:AMP-binding protein, partial [Methanobrevibacter sp.]|uniref:AMP-binding protein n=1 Tax=Methanobrevibacter sp. TaxID=66852 RepID=UPI00386BD581
MKNNVKFVMNLEDCNYNVIEEAFKKAKGIFNWQLDEDYNAILINEDIDYRFIDVLDFKKDIGDLTDSFFKLDFDDSINVPLYKFMVLKDNDKFKILANISSLIFDYTSINDFYELFDDLNKSSLRNDLDTHYTKVNDYLNSPDFKKNKNYWKNFILNSNNHVKFYNLKDNNCKSQTINVNEDSVNSFINANSCSLFEFYGSAFSMYLSRIDRLDGSILKTVIPQENVVLDKNALLKVDVNRENSFNDLIDVFRQTLVNALEKTKVDITCYLDENPSYYSIHDFTDLNRNIRVLNGDNSALTLNIYNDSLELVYNSNLFSDIYINHMVGNIESLIDELLHFPTQLIRDIDVLSSEEKALLLKYCKGKRAKVDENRFLSHGFRENALNNPDALAVDDGVNKITFGELEKSSNSIANDLRENYNIGQGSRVALMLMRDYHFPEIVLALNKINATFVPIDLFYPIKRIEYMLNLSQSEYIIATKTIADSFDLKQKVIYLEDLNDSDEADVEITTMGDDLFTILFTSGTTGLPKGVMVSNSQLPRVGTSFKEIFNYSEGDVIGHYLGFTFVASFVIYATLYFGGCCRIFNEKEQKDSLLLIKELKENHLNSIILPPGIGIPIYENEDLQLDYLVLAGAKLNELSKKKKHTRLVNFYGTTEIICGVTKIYDSKDIKDNNVPLGSPVANTDVYILDDENNQMPIGVPGEICVSNNFMSRGYLDNPELTDELFIENPLSDSEYNRIMYRTGDIGFYNFDGEIEIIGREDDQLSVRGFRIESDEILRIMNGFNEILDIYLDVDNDNLIAYYTTDDNLDINEVKEALMDELPYYMIPSLFIELDEIPLNINGKIDKSRLKTAINNESIEIADEVIRAVADAFKEVLNLDFVLIDDDFIALGGNSLSAMKLQLAVNEKLGVYLSSNELIELSTPNNIANHIKFNLNIHTPIDDDNYTFDKAWPLSESHLNVYLDESVNDMGTAYNNPFKIDFNDNYSVEEIRNALIKLFEVFPVLKARILNDDGDLFFTFDGEPEINEGSVNDIKSFVKPFKFDKSLSRFLIVENSLCADFHHMIFDGTSLKILLNRLISILSGEETDFTDYGLLRQISFEENIDSDYMDGAHEFFSLMLADVEEIHDLLPSVNDDNDEFEFIDSFDIDFEDLNSFLQSHKLTHNQFFASVFAYTLSRFTSSDKILFNIIEDGRGHIDLSDSVGMFVKTLPVLIDCSNNDANSFLDYSSDLINSVMKYDL